jgi:CubicO group peptidase (beta-lactamase class C family)
MSECRELCRSSRLSVRSILTCLFVAVSPAILRAEEPKLAGHWQGEIATPGKPLAIDLDFSAAQDGSWRGDISIPSEGTKDRALAGIVAKDSEITFTMAGVPGDPIFKGRLDQEGKTLSGTFTQGGASFPFHVERAVEAVTRAKQSLIGFDSFIEVAIRAWEVPGLAIAIVKNGQVVLEHGFGYRDVAHKLPVTPKTLFAIGSCTKAFTTFVIGTLVDEGKLDWDTPVRTYIPEIRFHDRVASELMTARDLVTHRSGLPRHDLVWYNAALSRKEVVQRLPYLEPSETFRSKFQYNNLMYIVAGYLVDRVTGGTWEDAVRTRILTPLGMSSSNFSVKHSQQSSDFAKPYDDRDDKIVEIPFRDITDVGPAGSINSNAADMARWLVVHIQEGKFDGRQIVSRSVLADIHAPHMTTGERPERPEISPDGYGLGWEIDEYRGHRRVQHAGGIDGFTSLTTLFPADGLGMVILTNMNGTPLPEMVCRHAADRLLSLSPIDWSADELRKKALRKDATKKAKEKRDTVRRPGTSPAHPLAEYAGAYGHPGYGIVRVELKDGKLHFRYNGIEAPLAHWHYEVFNGLKNPKDPEFENQKVQFLTGFKGYVDALAVAFEPREKPIVFARRPDSRLSDPAYLKQFIGEYELAGRTLSVRLEGTTLALDSQGRDMVTLVPDRDDGFKIKEQPETSLRFVTDSEHHVSEIALDTAAGVFTAKRKKP